MIKGYAIIAGGQVEIQTNGASLLDVMRAASVANRYHGDHVAVAHCWYVRERDGTIPYYKLGHSVYPTQQ